MSSYIGKININNTEYPIAQSLFGTCNTPANTATKVVTCADFDTLISGIVINVYFTYANTESSISLNVNSTGNKTVYVDNNSSILWDADATKSFVYYNNQWRLINPTSVGTTYSAATTATAGLMSTDDKIKLNSITTGASTYAAGTGLSLSGTTFNHTNSITASSVGSSVATSGATLDIPYAKYDAQGHITAKGVHVHTIESLAASAITSGTFTTARIPNLPTSIITSGTFATARIPNLPTSIITSGTFSTARLPVSTSVGNDNNLPTGAAVQSYVTGLGYEANQNAFSNVAVGSSTIAADTKTDTLTLAGAGSVTLSANTSTDTITITGTDTTYGSATTAAAGLMSAADKLKVDELNEKYVPIQYTGSISTATINYLNDKIKLSTSSTWSGFDQYISIEQGDYPNIRIGQSADSNSSLPSSYIHLFSGSGGLLLYSDNEIHIGTGTTSGVHITLVADPVNDEDAVNKRYIDNIISGGILKGIRINSSDQYVSSLGSNVYLITHNQGFAENFTSTVMVKDSGSSNFYQAINDDGVSLVYTIDGKIRYDIFDIQENQFKIEFSSTPYQFSILININYDSLSLVDADSTETLLNI